MSNDKEIKIINGEGSFANLLTRFRLKRSGDIQKELQNAQAENAEALASGDMSRIIPASKRLAEVTERYSSTIQNVGPAVQKTLDAAIKLDNTLQSEMQLEPEERQGLWVMVMGFFHSKLGGRLVESNAEVVKKPMALSEVARGQGVSAQRLQELMIEAGKTGVISELEIKHGTPTILSGMELDAAEILAQHMKGSKRVVTERVLSKLEDELAHRLGGTSYAKSRVMADHFDPIEGTAKGIKKK